MVPDPWHMLNKGVVNGSSVLGSPAPGRCWSWVESRRARSPRLISNHAAWCGTPGWGDSLSLCEQPGVGLE